MLIWEHSFSQLVSQSVSQSVGLLDEWLKL